MIGFKKGNIVLITKGNFVGAIGEFLGYLSGDMVLVQLASSDKPVEFDIDSVMLYCTHNKEEQKKEVEIKAGDKVRVTDIVMEHTVICKPTKNTFILLTPWGESVLVNADKVEPMEEPKIDISELFDSIDWSTVNMLEELSIAVATTIDKQIEELGYDGWARLVLNTGVDQYVESLFSKYINN